MATDQTVRTREVIGKLRGQATSDGAGVRMTRVIGTPRLDHFDPFLLLDEFRSDDPNDYIAGFPDHPHRGFETVTYMLAGRMKHGDNQGNTGLLGPGSVQWMTAGRGIVHSEFPQQVEGLMWGFQLWVNLPAKDKMTAPRYQDIQGDDIPEVEAAEGVHARVIRSITICISMRAEPSMCRCRKGTMRSSTSTRAKRRSVRSPPRSIAARSRS